MKGKNLNIIDGIKAAELIDPLLISEQNVSNLRRGEIGQVKRVSRRLDYHVMKPKSGHRDRTSAAFNNGGLQVAGESGEEVLDHPNLPVGGGFRREAEDFGRALVLVTGAERALGLRIGVGSGVILGFEIRRPARSGQREYHPAVVNGVFPDLGAPTCCH